MDEKGSKTKPTAPSTARPHRSALTPLEREASTISRQLRLLEELQNGEEQELLITAQALILCGLPYKPLAAAHYQRQARTAHGLVRLTVSALDPGTPLPFGKDRVTLAWLTTKAVQTGNPVVEWDTASEFFELFGLNRDGRTYRQFWESWKRLAKAAFVLEVVRTGHDSGRVAPILERWDLPTMRDRRKEETGLVLLPGMRYGVELGRTLWDHLKAHPIPLPLAVMREFQDEPKAWDFAAFVTWRSYLCLHAGSVARIAWRDLVQQLGSHDKDHKQLRKSLREICRRLRLVWPEVRADFLPGGVLEIHPPARGILPVKGRQKA